MIITKPIAFWPYDNSIARSIFFHLNLFKHEKQNLALSGKSDGSFMAVRLP